MNACDNFLSSTPVKKALRWSIATMIAALCLAYLIFRFNWSQTIETLESARWGLLCSLGSMLIILHWIIRTWRWKLFVTAHGHAIPFTLLYRSMTISLALGVVTPGNAGEAIKLWHLKKQKEVNLATGTGGLLAERFADILTLGAITLFALVFHADFILFKPIAYISLVAIGVIALLSLAFRHGVKFKPATQIIDGFMIVTKQPSQLFNFFILTIASWLVTVGIWTVAFISVDVHIPITMVAFITGSVVFATIVTLVPGGVGVSELGITSLLIANGISADKALAAALAARSLTILTLLLSGLHWVIFYLFRQRASLPAAHEASTPLPDNSNSNRTTP